ncbi:indole-3-glycerol phosphate synthase-domain-containing protein [Melampsora americana]|nr:indole-3-glycerol phosphate synthase-domain-containing protein [Melampsora americana]
MAVEPIQVLMLDNYDSFTWNLYQYLSLLGANVTVVRSQSCTLEDLIEQYPLTTHLVISPGPGHPTTDAGISIPAILHYSGKLPILGICMGLQCIYTAFGGVVDSVGAIVHGKTSKVFHDQRGLFKSVSQGIDSTRYHSLAGQLGTLPDDLEVTAWSNPNAAVEAQLHPSTSIIMAIRHKTFTIEAVQYHPESILSQEGKLLLENFLKLKGGLWADNPQYDVSKSQASPSPSSAAPSSSSSLPTILQSICRQRLLDIIDAKKTPGSSPNDLQQKIKLHVAPTQLDFYRRLKQTSSDLTPNQSVNEIPHVALMAEIKRASPSKGSFVTSTTPTPPEIALSYAIAGASTISVLTEPTWFKGTLMDMLSVRLALEQIPNRPAILRKDFILDTYQIDEARCYGADTVLLIVACLSEEKLKLLFDHSKSLGMEPLVEVNNEEELKVALKIGSRVIGVNNRNLHDFNVDMSTTSRMVQAIRHNDSDFETPSSSTSEVIICALSGISSRADVERYVQEGVGAVLVGESLMKANDKRMFVRELLGTTPQLSLPQNSRPCSPLVKICGIKTPEMALSTAQAGADLIGLIFVPKSRRYVTPAQATSIIQHVRASRSTASSSSDPLIESAPTQVQSLPNDWFELQSNQIQSSPTHRKPMFVGVFQDAPLSEILSIIEQVPIDFVQLHGHEPIQLSNFIPLPVIKTFHIQLDKSIDLSNYIDLFRPGYHSLPLLDSQTSNQTGGTGEVFEWDLLDSIIPNDKTDENQLRPFVLAGGLKLENVEEAIRKVKPLIVDVSGGVENEKGEKDLKKVKEFILAVKNSLVV